MVALPEGLEPVWVEEAGCEEGRFNAQPATYQRKVGDWLCAAGYAAGDTKRVEVYLLDAPFARVFQFVRDEHGRKVLNEAGDGERLVVRTAVLSSLPPSRDTEAKER